MASSVFQFGHSAIRPFGHSKGLDFEQFALFDGAEFDLGAAEGDWVVVVTDFPEELGDAVGPLASCVMMMVLC